MRARRSRPQKRAHTAQQWLGQERETRIERSMIAWTSRLLGRHDEARPYFAKAHRALAADTSPDRVDHARLARLERLAH